ncbi:MAG: hypothetical protein WCA20_03745, partial [Candidatus Sulfotelmatobacter sp.]
AKPTLFTKLFVKFSRLFITKGPYPCFACQVDFHKLVHVEQYRQDGIPTILYRWISGDLQI